MLDRLEALGAKPPELEAEPEAPVESEVPVEPERPLPKGLWMAKRQPWAYVVIPKSACTTAGQYLYYADHGYYYHDDVHRMNYGLYKAGHTQEAVRDRLAEAGEELFTFSFTRDPYARLVSAFLDKVADLEQGYRPDFKDHLSSDWGVQLAGGSQTQNFKNFIRFLEHQYQQWELFQENEVAGGVDHREAWEKVDIHWLRQSWYMRRGRRHSSQIDFIGTVETMQDDLEQLSVDLAPPHIPPLAEMPKFGAGPRREAPLEDYFDDAETRRIVLKYFAPDFRLFGYSNEPGGPPEVLDGYERAARFEDDFADKAEAAMGKGEPLDIDDDDRPSCAVPNEPDPDEAVDPNLR